MDSYKTNPSSPAKAFVGALEKGQKMMNQSEIVCSGEIEKRRIQGLSFWSAGVETLFGHSKGSRAIVPLVPKP